MERLKNFFLFFVKYILFLLLCITVQINVHAEIICTQGTLEDWDRVCEISRTINIPLINELKENSNLLVTSILNFSNPKKFITENLAQTKKRIFIEKSCEFFVLRTLEHENNTPKIVGFFSFVINSQNKAIAHLSQYGYIEEEISTEDFVEACLQYFFQTQKYREIKVLFALDLFAWANGPNVTISRKQIKKFGFTECDHQKAFDFMPFITKYATKVLFPTQAYVLDLRSPHIRSSL